MHINIVLRFTNNFNTRFRFAKGIYFTQQRQQGYHMVWQNSLTKRKLQQRQRWNGSLVCWFLQIVYNVSELKSMFVFEKQQI